MAIFFGTAGDDVYTGGGENDTIDGKGGNDRLFGNGGNDDIAGGAGSDTIDGGDGGDTLYSGERSPAFNLPYFGNPFTLPVLDTGTEVDTINGGDGGDRLFAGYGDNVDGGGNGLYGRGDYLFISFQGAPSGVTFDGRLATQTIGGGTITGIENISYVQGSEFDDDINVGSSTNNGYSDFTAVLGMGGNDKLVAGYYTGALYGGDGNDIVDGRGSQYLSLVDGGAGDDILYTNTNTFAVANGGDGNDTIYAHGTIFGGAGNDKIFVQGSYYGGRVSGDDGDDEIEASSSGTAMAGGAGADILRGSTGDDSIGSGEFNSTSSYNNPGPLFADDLGLEHDQLFGGAGNDTLSAGYGDDVDGGEGTDTLRLSLGGATTGVVFDTTGVVGGQPFSFGGGTIQNVETLTYLGGSAFDDQIRVAGITQLLTVEGGAGNDTLTSTDSSVTFNGGAGDDRLVSGIAGDIFNGGAGVDTIDYSLYASGVTVTLGATQGANGTGAGGDTLANVERVIGSAFADTITGSGDADILIGGAGNDVLSGLGGDDLFIGGAGNDSIDGGAGFDTVDYGQSTVGVTVTLGTTQGVAGSGAGGDTLVNIERVIGSALADTITGSADRDTLIGGGGDDVLRGLGGDDLFIGGPGKDSIDGGEGYDTVDYSQSASGVTVRFGTAQSTPAGPNVDTLVAVERVLGSRFADTIAGGADADLLFGVGGNDVLQGLDGNDILVGGAGNDTIDGGVGYDTAVFYFNLSQVTITRTSATTVMVAGPDGTDSVTNVESLQFSNVRVSLNSADPFFDALFYSTRYADIAASGVDAYTQYVQTGRDAGRDPNAFFSVQGYLANNPDVAASGLSPLQHYVQVGAKEGRDPSAGFDTELYLVHNPDVAAAGINALEHYLNYGRFEGRPSYEAIGSAITPTGFDPDFYLLSNPDVAAAGMDPLDHYLRFGAAEGRDPNAWFDTSGYLAAYPDVAAAGVNPLEHFHEFGWKEGRDPSGEFDTKAYLAAYPDVAQAGIDPLLHYLQFGAYEQRDPHTDFTFG